MKTFPVIASIISPTELGAFINEQYQLENHFECKLFRTGVNHTYFLSNVHTKYVVRVYCHNWRETGTDLRYLQEIWGHCSSHAAKIYTHVSTSSLQNIRSPFDDL